ncbi:zf-CHY-domain-containing protein [Ascodesmis nigricans]|uniref:Zf-CHY-domain-containing protein n=1 Tax=Ascodesmis nigricans TaxID=341454 RepID=A0A4S2MUW9_9PEZI|nr:zf-CHY-domain-containing protein [Ascodesmis nigricans]
MDIDLPSLPSTTSAADLADNPYKLQPGDDRTTYYSGPNPLPGVQERGCAHYRRNVRLQCSTCERWYTCRFCHDENEDHALIRQQTKNMLCMPCGRPQPAGQDCRFCGVRSAKYYCDKCKLWDDDPQKSIYHCNDCGICRIGQGLGKDFFHCKKCGVCMSIKLENSHRCIERSTECDCPICGEFMFTSTLTVVFMTCGHSIHHKCYYEHMKSSYRCPTCARTIINMESQFRALDIEIQNQPLPAPYSDWRCLISCNDCAAKSNVSFHFLGLKCNNCQSYNTSQIRILRPEDEPNATAAPPAGGNSPTVSRPPFATNMAVPSVATLGMALAGAPQESSTSASATLSPEAIEERRRSGASTIEIATGLEIDHGDDDLIVDDDGGWVTESEPETEGSEYDESADGRKRDDIEEEDDDDDDDPEYELINLIGHL